ncbi:uncharacterized protein LOC132173430 isoform X2 [Corylus avellana]|uniref:uncharacterized protein LOC132173430 isoform X2 n=1 Tax=Corylus avellana TaxID=13451 RepID=UPI00286AA48A|nr:uncharacterized protein LOC132173430 isoform X2 [Corylus avellana]
MACASRRCLTTLTHHGASHLSNLQRLKPPTASRSLCYSSLIERVWTYPIQLSGPYDPKMEREKAIMGYRFSKPSKLERWQVEMEALKAKLRKKELKERRQSSFKPSVLFFVGKQPYEALRGDIIHTERLNFANVNDKVYFVKVALLSLDKYHLTIRWKNHQFLRRAYVEAVIVDQGFTKLRVLDFGLVDKRKLNLV